MVRTQTNTAADAQILVAVLTSPHGIHGAIYADRLTDNPQRLTAGASLYTETGEALQIEKASLHKGRLLLTFCGICDRNAAEALRGTRLFVPASALPELPQGSYYHHQLVGLTVVENGLTLGTISEVLSYTANDIYLMQRPDGKEVLIPALKSVVKEIDLTAGTMTVVLPQGLL